MREGESNNVPKHPGQELDQSTQARSIEMDEGQGAKTALVADRETKTGNRPAIKLVRSEDDTVNTDQYIGNQK